MTKFLGFSGSSWGVIGSRDLAPSWSPAVGRLVRALVENGAEVCTGSCPSGADAFVRSAFRFAPRGVLTHDFSFLNGVASAAARLPWVPLPFGALLFLSLGGVSLSVSICFYLFSPGFSSVFYRFLSP